MKTIALLFASNVFMTAAWYGHLRFKETPLIGVILASWGIAFAEYCMAVPANRLGSAVYTTVQLKTVQEIVTLLNRHGGNAVGLSGKDGELVVARKRRTQDLGFVGEVVEAVYARGGACLITADHGNCDHMLEPDGSPNTAHSLNPVPVIVTADVPGLRDGGILADVAPTVLELLGIEQPPQMTGRSLIAAR